MLAGCSGTPKPVLMATLYAFRLDPPALVELTADGRIQKDVAVAIPGGCKLDGIFAPPAGEVLAMELGCEFGQAVLWVNTGSGEVKQPITDSDSHFMAWAPDGQSVYLKVDSMNRPHIVRAWLAGKLEFVPITGLAYDVSPKIGSQSDFLFSFSRGMGLGSEMWFAWSGGQVVKLIIADAQSYLSLARWSPDKTRIAFIKIPDSATPFTVGELWVMQSDGSGARKLAAADAGHGFAEAWSPDGSRIAFVVRENPNDPQADQDAGALQSNIVVVDLRNGSQSALTQFKNARVEAPAWSPDGNRLAFTVVLNDKMNVYIADMTSGKIQQSLPVSSCCPVWIRK
jgi:Tol biopolymer transport system component